jgi:hypothetical protein
VRATFPRRDRATHGGRLVVPVILAIGALLCVVAHEVGATSRVKAQGASDVALVRAAGGHSITVHIDRSMENGARIEATSRGDVAWPGPALPAHHNDGCR